MKRFTQKTFSQIQVDFQVICIPEVLRNQLISIDNYLQFHR